MHAIFLCVGDHPALNAYFMAFAAGAMIFVALHELVPMARQYGRIGWFAAGLVLVMHRLLALPTIG